MKHPRAHATIIIAVLVTLGAPAVSAQGIKNRELLGVRVGGTISSSELNDAFGNGSELELHFIKGFTPWFGVDVSLSSHNFGESLNSLKNIEFIGINREVDLHVFSMTAAMIVVGKFHERIMPNIEAGLGVYSVTTSVPTGYYEAQNTDNRFGLYGGAGFFVKMTKRFMLNMNAKYHYVFIGDDEWDTIRFYTGQKSARFLQIAFGIAIYTG